MKIEIKIDHDFTVNGIKYNIPIGTVISANVINNERNNLPKSYKINWNGEEVLVPAFKCFEIYEKEENPEKLKELDDWFDQTTEKFVEIEKNYTEIIITMRKRESYYSEWKKTITFKPDGKDKITFNDVVELKDKLDKLIEDKEEEKHNSGKFPFVSFDLNWVSAISGNNISFIFGSKYEESCPTSEISKYWRLILKYFGLKEELPKYTKLKSVQRYGVCRFPDYNDMFYIETNAKQETVDEFYDGNDVKKLVKKLLKEGFKAKTINIDYILKDNIIKTNKIEI